MRRDIYLLHITCQDSAILHYLGSTRRGRFNERIAEHRYRLKKHFEREAKPPPTNVEAFIVRTNQTLQDEAYMLLTNDWRDLCPLCQKNPPPEPKTGFEDEPRWQQHS